jgi:hypothetical protein
MKRTLRVKQDNVSWFKYKSESPVSYNHAKLEKQNCEILGFHSVVSLVGRCVEMRNIPEDQYPESRH